MIIHDSVNQSSRLEKYNNAISCIEDAALREFAVALWDFSWKGSLAGQNIKSFNIFVEFCSELASKSVSSISWRFVCGLVGKKEAFGYHCMHLMHYLLEKDLYANEYADELKQLKNVFVTNNKGQSYSYYKTLFAYENARYLYFTNKDLRKNLYVIRTDNPFLLKLLKEFCLYDLFTAAGTENIATRDWFYANVEALLGNYASELHRVSDFNYAVLKTMLTNGRSYPEAVALYRKIFAFFRFLLNYPGLEGKNILKATDPLPVQALNRKTLALDIINGYEYHFYEPDGKAPAGDKWILDINGHDTGAAKASEAVLFDFTDVGSAYYRSCLKQFVWYDASSSLRTKRTKCVFLGLLLNVLSSIKEKTAYEEAVIRVAEIAELEQWIRKNYPEAASRIKCRTVMRRFLAYGQESGCLSVEPDAEKQLAEYLGKPKGKSYTPIPMDDLDKLQAVVEKHAEESPLSFYCYVVFMTLLHTNYEVSELCHLQLESLMVEGAFKGYLIKTFKSYPVERFGDVVNEHTKGLLDRAVELSESFRAACPIPGITKYLFLYKSLENKYTPLAAARFSFYLKQRCAEAGIKDYTSSNLKGVLFKR